MTRAILVASLVLVAALASGCGGDDEPAAMTRGDFESGLIAHEHVTPEAASCASGYLVGQFPDGQLHLLLVDNPANVPPQLWGRYTQVMLACAYHGDLGVTEPPGQAAP